MTSTTASFAEQDTAERLFGERVTLGPGETAELTLRPGERRVLLLQEMGSAGYVWSFDAAHAVGVTVERVAELSPRGVGSFSDLVVTLEGLAPGRDIFVQRQPWLESSNGGTLDILVTNDAPGTA